MEEHGQVQIHFPFALSFPNGSRPEYCKYYTALFNKVVLNRIITLKLQGKTPYTKTD